MDKISARDIFRRNLTYYMNKKNVEQADIVEALGLSASTMSDWTLGKKYPRVDSMQKLADYFGIAMSELTSHQLGEGRADAPSDWSSPLTAAYATAVRPTQDAVCAVLGIDYVDPSAITPTLVPFRRVAAPPSHDKRDYMQDIITLAANADKAEPGYLKERMPDILEALDKLKKRK